MTVFLISLGLSLALCALARPVLRRMGVIDKPNARSSHTVPTVRGLGVGIAAAVIIGWILGGVAVSPVVITMALAGLVLSVVSFTDDMRPVSPLVRFGCHTLAAVAALTVLCLGWHDRPEPLLLTVMLPVGFLFIAGYTNAFNFMDGINGIAGFQGLLTALGTAGLMVFDGASWDSAPVIAALVVAGACAGFLPHNFPKARGFMGDVASATLGYWLSAIVLWCVCERGLHLLVPLAMLHANFILDTGVTLVRRKLRGEKLSQAHREHFYQLLVRSGSSHSSVTLTEAAGQLVVFGLMGLFLKYDLPVKVMALGVSVALWAAYFLYAERQFKGAASPEVRGSSR
jgi:UDP-GlcNAc:undecaprenyl-phosphate GlcNAc-1-phosphate transferase